MRSSPAVVNETGSRPLARDVATSDPAGTSTSSGSGADSQKVTLTRRSAGTAHADQLPRNFT
jgi:hypothetical protein